MTTVTTQLNSGSTPISVPEGGTGIITTTPFAPIISGSTATGSLLQATTGLSSSSYYLTSTGSGSVPNFQSHNISFLTKNLLTSDIQGMNATPIQVLPNQGAHTLIVIYFMQFQYIFNTTAFSGGGTVQLQYGNSGSPQAAVICTGLNLTSNTSALFYGAADQQFSLFGVGPVSPVSGVINQGLYITNQSAPFTGGGTSSGIITLYYDVLSTTV